MWGGYRIWARLLGYEVTVRPAGIEGNGGGGLRGSMVRQLGGGVLKFFSSQLDLYVTGMNLGQGTGSVV